MLHRRRRSQSNSPKPHRTPEASWRAATKRTYPQHSFGLGPDLSSTHKWDVDVWRRGKRARRDISHSLDPKQIVPSDNHRSASRFAPPISIFAATSAEFQLFPKGDPSPSTTSSVLNPTLSEEDFRAGTDPDLTRLHSDAFWELRRSVVENGEGLVRRMRDYEHSRSRSDVYSKSKEARGRGRNRKSSLNIRHRKLVESDAEDDVQIFAGEQSVDQLFPSSRKQRAQSLGVMDMDRYTSGLEECERCSSPGATCDSVRSTYPSDNEDDQLTGPRPPSSSPSTMHKSALTPALSHTYSNSANSSLVSLRLPSPVSLSYSPSNISMLQFTAPHPLSLSASRSERAIAALSLAMANGAGGLNDYEALRAVQAPSVLDDFQVGELWH